MLVLCYEANCSSTTDSPAVSGGGGVAVGRGVAAPGSGTTEGGGGGEGERDALRRRGRRTLLAFPHISQALVIARMACQQLSVVGLQTCAEVYTHTCSTHAVLLTDSPLTGVC